MIGIHRIIPIIASTTKADVAAPIQYGNVGPPSKEETDNGRADDRGQIDARLKPAQYGTPVLISHE